MLLLKKLKDEHRYFWVLCKKNFLGDSDKKETYLKKKEKEKIVAKIN